MHVRRAITTHVLLTGLTDLRGRKTAGTSSAAAESVLRQSIRQSSRSDQINLCCRNTYRQDGDRNPFEEAERRGKVRRHRMTFGMGRETLSGQRQRTSLEAQILQSVGHAIVAGDFDGNITYWNKAAESLYGWRAGEVVGRNAREVGAPTFPEADAQEIIAAIREGKSWAGELPLQRRDGSQFQGAVVCAPLRDQTGELIGVASSVRDVTARAHAEAAAQQMAESLANAQRIAKLGSWEWDVQTGEVRWSDQLFEILSMAKSSAPRYEAFIERVHPDDRERMQEELRLSVIDRPEIEQDYRLLLPDGTIKMVHARAVFTRDEDGRALRLTGTTQDITDRGQAQEALRVSEERFRSLVDVTAAVFWWTDAAGQVTEATPSWTEFTGMSAEEMTQRDGWFSAVHPDDRAGARAGWREAVERGTDYYNEYRLRRHDGIWRDMIARGAAMRNADDTIREWVGTCVDVTELKTAQEAVRFQAQVLDTTRESIIATDPAGKIIYMNRFAGAQFRVKPEEAIGADIMEVTVPNTSREQAEEIMETLRRGETWSGEFIAGRRDGSKFPIRANNTPLYNEIGELVAIVEVARDMSEYHESQRALRESEERYRATFDQAAVGICQIRFDGRFEKVNPRLCEMFGYSRAELLELKFSDITHPEDLARSVQLVGELSKQKRNSFAIDKRYVRKDGRMIWAFSTVSLMRDAEGKPQSLIANVEDISARKEAEEKLRFQAHILDHIGEAVIATSPDGTVIYLNRRAESLYGWPKADAIGRHVFEVTVPEATRPEAEAVMQMMRRGGRSSGEYLLRHRDGSSFPAFVSNSVLVNEQGEIQAIIGMSTNVTERNRARQRLVDSEARLRALTARLEKSREEERTRIAREIHDELGQLLTGLKMDLRWVENWLEKTDDPRLRPFLDRIVGGTELADAVIKAVQAIATDLRPGVLDTLGLAAALEFEARRFQERTGTACMVEGPPELPRLSQEVTTALFRIFQECLTNVARHSGATRVDAVLEKGEGEVCLCITDNGCGIADIEKVAAESLGLVGITERVTLLGGQVSFSSPTGNGTTVRVRLPQLAEV